MPLAIVYGVIFAFYLELAKAQKFSIEYENEGNSKTPNSKIKQRSRNKYPRKSPRQDYEEGEVDDTTRRNRLVNDQPPQLSEKHRGVKQYMRQLVAKTADMANMLKRQVNLILDFLSKISGRRV